MHDRLRVPHTRVGERPRGRSVARDPSHALLSLQQTVGNRAVTDILARDDKEQAKPKAPADAFREAVKGKAWPAAAKALNNIPGADVQGLLKPLAAGELDKLDAAAGKLKDLPLALRIRTHRHIVFLRRPMGLPTDLSEDFKVTGAGKAEPTHKAGGGDVTVSTGVSGKAGSEDANDAVSMSYSGKDAGKTLWLQFISREVVIPATDRPRRSGRGYDGRRCRAEVRPHHGSGQAGLEHRHPRRRRHAVLRGVGTSNRTAEATTIFDTPTPVADVVRKQLEGGASTWSHARTSSPTSCATCRCSTGWRSISSGRSRRRGASRRKPTVTQGAASELDTAHRVVLEKQFPKFAYLP